MTARCPRAVLGAATAALLAGMLAPVAVPAAAAAPPAAAAAPIVRAELPDWCVPDPPPTGPSPVLTQLGVDRAWDLTRGAGATVAVVDSGVLPSEPHLGDDAVLPGHDPLGILPGSESATEGPAWSSTDGRTDIHYHGTAAAGLIAAREAEGSVVVGVAPEATILPVRAFASDHDDFVELGYGPDVGRIADGIRWAADNGAQIISVSMSTTEDSEALAAAVTHATEQGALVVASAGNLASAADVTPGPRYPAAYPEAVAVAATTIDGIPADDSVRGEHVDVAAPGDVAWTVFLDEGDCFIGGGGQTSWATAYVAAAAALVAARHPEETPAQWRHRLLVTAVRPVPSERDDEIGWGIVAPYEALAFVDDGAAPGPASPVHEAPSAEAATFVPVPERTADPLEAVRGTAAWWVFGAFVVVGAAGLVARAPRRDDGAEASRARPPGGDGAAEGG